MFPKRGIRNGYFPEILFLMLAIIIKIKTIIDEIKLHSKYKCVTLSTNKKNVGFYEKCGLTLAGKLKFNKTYRYFLTKTI